MTVDTIPAASGPLVLAKRLDLTEAAALRQSLLDRAGQAVTLDAGRVAHLGGLCLQVLLSAARDWRAAGRALKINARSAGFDAALSTFAVPLASLESAVAT